MTQHGAAGGEIFPTERRRLPIAGTRRRARGGLARGVVIALGVLAAALFGTSYSQPWWTFKLYAPQYPKGLTLVISLTGMGGDVHEIDLLNHYIGMARLAEAAPLERELAGWGVAVVCILTVAGMTSAGKRLNKLVAIPAVSFPVLFLALSVFWLYKFGHELDPRAPIKLGAFTPEMFGNGKIGQFETFATPAVGFWLAVAGAVCAIVAAVVRARVCSGCSREGTCKVGCARFMVLPDDEDRAA